MIVETVSAPALAPLCGDAKLELPPGMTLIHGLNESGKSMWHAATTQPTYNISAPVVSFTTGES
jgi:hypothetical protein